VFGNNKSKAGTVPAGVVYLPGQFYLLFMHPISSFWCNFGILMKFVYFLFSISGKVLREELDVMKVTTTTKVNGPKTNTEGTEMESKTSIPGNVPDTQTKEGRKV
jgi:hypothetical protein